MDLYVEMARLGDEVAAIEARMADVTKAGLPIGDFSRPRSARDRLEIMALHQAATLISAASDHLRTVALIAQSRVIPAFALMSLIRTSYECALLAQWLVDDVPRDERTLRGVRVQYDDLVERRKFEVAIGRPKPSSGKLAEERIKDLIADAASLSLLSVREDGSTITPTPPPSVVQLFDMYESRAATDEQPAFKGQSYYRLLSGYAHGKQWAVTLGMQPVGSKDPHGNGVGFLTANDKASLGLMSRSLERLRLASQAYLELCLEGLG